MNRQNLIRFRICLQQFTLAAPLLLLSNLALAENSGLADGYFQYLVTVLIISNVLLLGIILRNKSISTPTHQASTNTHPGIGAIETYQSVFDAIHDPVIIIDDKGIIHFFNSSAEEMFGYHKNEIINKNASCLMEQEHAEYMQSYFETGISKLIGTGRQLTAKTKDNNLLPIELNIGSMEIDGQVMFVGIISDISHQVFSTNKINMLNEMLESSPDCISVFDMEGYIEFMNPAGRKMLGYDETDDLSEVKINGLFPESEIDLMLNEAVPIAYMQGSWQGETQVFAANNKIIDVSQVLVKLKTTHNGKHLYSSIMRDISEQVNSRKELKLSKEAAESATKAKSLFLATMSHEIRTPMNGVLGMTQLLTNTKLSSQQREFVRTIYDSGQALLTIINDILDYSKIEAGKLEFENIPFNLPNIIKDVEKLFHFPAEEKNLEIIHSYTEAIPTEFKGDPGRIRQIILNLVSNAIKFTDQGSITISVSETKKTNSKPMIEISVIDTGIGISKDAQKNLFNSFTQADASTTRKFGGTGLGLAISKKLIELMKGEIYLESEPGKGTTFTLALPLQEAVIQSYNVENVNLSDKHAIVAYSDELFLQHVAGKIEECGLKSTHATNFEELKKLLSNKKLKQYDLILIDHDISGYETLNIIDELNEISNVHVPNIIVWTNNSARGDSNEYSKAGYTGFITGHVKSSILKNILSYSIGINSGKNTTLITKHNVDELIAPAIEEKRLIFNEDILIVEDNQVNQLVAKSMLENFGANIKIANNGEEAITALKEKSYSLVFMDCQMPVMDGYEATQAIRKSEADTDAHTIIVAMTANAMQEDKNKCIQSGMDDFISKPFTQQELLSTLNKWLGGQDTTVSKIA